MTHAHVLMLLFAASSLMAQDEPKIQAPDPAAVAAACCVADERQDREQMQALASTPELDGFLVVDCWLAELLADPASRTGSTDPVTIARAFAEHAQTQPGQQQLVAWVASWSAFDQPAMARERELRDLLANALSLAAAKQWAELRAAIEPIASSARPATSSVTFVRIVGEQARALLGENRPAEAAAAHRAASAAAERLGWMLRAIREADAAGDAESSHKAWNEALVDYERVLALSEATGRKTDAAAAVASIAAVHGNRGDLDRAVDGIQRARQLQLALGNRIKAAELLQDEGVFEAMRGRHDDSLDLYQRSQQELLDAGDALGAARKLLSIGVAHCRAGRAAQAIPCFEQGCQELERLEDLPTAAAGWQWIGRCHADLGRHVPAREAYERARSIFQGLGQRVEANSCLAWIGDLHFRFGQYAEARTCNEAVLLEWEALGRESDLASALANLGLACGMLGEHARAFELLERSLAAHRAAGNQEGIASVLDGLGLQQAELGNNEKALNLHLEALELYESLGDRQGIAVALHNSAAVLGDLERVDEATEYYERALALTTASGDTLGSSRILHNIGYLLLSQREFDRALGYLERGAALRQDNGDPDGAATMRHSIGMVYLQQGRFEQALELFREALAVEERVGSLGVVTSICANLAEAHHRLGHHAEAFAAARRYQELILQTSRGLGDLTVGNSRRSMPRAAEVALQAAQALLLDPDRLPEPVLAEALAAIEHARAQVLAESLASRANTLVPAVPADLMATETQARERVQEARDEVARHGRTGAATAAQLPAAKAALGQAYGELEAATARIQRTVHRAADAMIVPPVALAALQHVLGEGTALVLYQATRERLFAMVVRPQASALLDLGSVAEIQDLVHVWLRILPIAASEERGHAESLYARLVRPLEPHLATARRLLIAPDGELSFLPFEALVRVDGEQSQRVLERWQVTYTPSATIHSMLMGNAAPAPGQRLIALGDPTYPDEPESQASADLELRGLGKLSRLRGSGDEVRALAEPFAPECKTVLLRGDATRERLLAALASPGPRLRALHLACHGHIDHDRPQLTGVVLAHGALLTLDDIVRLELAADLVVLSACESARGQIRTGEGVMGLTRAFFAAGASRVVVANWRVADDPTRNFMAAFYGRMQEGTLAPSAALRAAKLAQLQAGGAAAHPSQWASFVLWGRPD